MARAFEIALSNLNWDSLWRKSIVSISSFNFLISLIVSSMFFWTRSSELSEIGVDGSSKKI